MVRKCPNCGNYVSETDSKCPKCGMVMNSGSNSKISKNEEFSDLRNKIDIEYKACKRELNLDTTEPSLTFNIEKMEYPGGRVNITIMYDLDWSKDVSALLRAKELLSKFKQSPYFSEIEDWDEDIEEERLLCSGSVLKADVPSYLAELMCYFGFKPSDISKSKGCFGVLLLFVLCSITASLFIL